MRQDLPGKRKRPAWLLPCMAAPPTAPPTAAAALRQPPLIPGWERKWERDSLSDAISCAVVLASAGRGLRRCAVK